MNGQPETHPTRLTASPLLTVGVVRAATRKACTVCRKRRVCHAMAYTLFETSFVGPWFCRVCADAPD